MEPHQLRHVMSRHAATFAAGVTIGQPFMYQGRVAINVAGRLTDKTHIVDTVEFCPSELETEGATQLIQQRLRFAVKRLNDERERRTVKPLAALPTNICGN